MSQRKDASEKIGLKLTAADRKLLLQECPSLDEDFAKAIRQTPPSEPVQWPLDDTDELLDALAADSNHAKDRKFGGKLDRLLDKIGDSIDKYEDNVARGKPDGIQMPGWLAALMIEGIKSGKSVSLPINPDERRTRSG